MQDIDVHFVDAFSRQTGTGNPAAVVVLEHWPSAAAMQALATTIDLSETAFVVPAPQGFAIRWFSPITEVDFCGHATLASASLLFTQHPEQDELLFHAAAVGQISVQKLADGRIEMAFPNRAPETIAEPPQALLDGLSIAGSHYLKNAQAYFVVYPSEDQVRDVRPNLEPLKSLGPLDVVVTAPGVGTYDFVSRYFWPANGGEEDPVTGSIHAGLAPYWCTQLDKTELVALQASSRSGELYCRLADDKVYVAGYCLTLPSRRMSLIEPTQS